MLRLFILVACQATGTRLLTVDLTEDSPSDLRRNGVCAARQIIDTAVFVENCY